MFQHLPSFKMIPQLTEYSSHRVVGVFGGVNITLGLDFVRTSPDHGTGLDIAGNGVANADSMIAAIQAAWALS